MNQVKIHRPRQEDAINIIRKTNLRFTNNEAEQACLGSVLIMGDTADRAQEWLARLRSVVRPEQFLNEDHVLIYEAMEKLVERGEPIDIISLPDMLATTEMRERYEGVTLFSYVRSLMDTPSVAENLEYYASLVLEAWRMQMLYGVLNGIGERITRKEDSSQTLIEAMEGILIELRGRDTTKHLYKISEIIDREMLALDERKQNPDLVTGIPTGFDDLDFMTAGFQPDDLIILAARSSMGKTSLGVQLAVEAARKTGKPAIIFSLEMPKEQLVARMICAAAQVDLFKYKRAMMLPEEWRRIEKAALDLIDIPVYINDTTGVSIADIQAQCRGMQRKKGLSIVMIDYLQEIAPVKQTGNRVQEVGEIAKNLKRIARDLSIPVIALSQLSREVEKRPDKRPMLSDLRESGNIEQAADLVMMLYRAAYYKPKGTAGEEEEDELPGGAEEAEIILTKQRNGATGVVKVAFFPQYTKFAELEWRYSSEEESTIGRDNY